MNPCKPSGLVLQVHEELRLRIRSGDLCIDATVGNGHDTFALAKLVGKDGLVFGFDIQKVALDRTQALLEENQVLHVSRLHCCCHSKMKGKIPLESKGRIRAVVFNLGYLPRADKCLVTRKESTIRAIKDGYSWLQKGGLLSVLAYRGHSGGSEEALAIETLVKEMDWRYRKFWDENSSTSPILHLIEKT